MDLKKFKRLENWASILIISFMILSMIDIVREYRAGETFSHLIFEIIISILAFIWSLFLWRNWIKTKNDLHLSQSTNQALNQENLKWKSENAKLLEGLTTSIHSQFLQWHLTPAETDVAFLLLRGFSFKEIAELRGSAEKTIRQHASMIYQKSCLSGRNELLAFFLDDLFTPLTPDR